MDTPRSRKGTSNTHIGFVRFEKLTLEAIRLSSRIGKQISPSQLNQYILDNYTCEAIEKYASENPK